MVQVGHRRLHRAQSQESGGADAGVAQQRAVTVWAQSLTAVEVGKTRLISDPSGEEANASHNNAGRRTPVGGGDQGG